jgi:hypothetical protein
MQTDIGFETKLLIQNSWNIKFEKNNKIVLLNNAQYEEGKNLAVFVEFGVGRVGLSNSHDKAEEANYEYNVVSEHKDDFGNWTFILPYGKESMNIESNFYQESLTKNGTPCYITQGSPATMFLYRAWESFRTSGRFKTLWEETKREVIG